MERVSIVEKEVTLRASAKMKKRLEMMRSESVYINQENEYSDVVSLSYEEEVPISKKILEYQDNENKDKNQQDYVFFMNQTTNE